MCSLIYANYAPTVVPPLFALKDFLTFLIEAVMATLGSSGILSNCQSTTILQTSMKKKTRLGAILSNWSSIAKCEYRFST